MLTIHSRALFTWLSNNIAWDEASSEILTPMNVIRAGRCVCRGAAGLYGTLALAINLKSDLIAGRSKTSHSIDYYIAASPPPFDQVDSDHVWNMITIKLYPTDLGSYKLIDSTWGSNGEIGNVNDRKVNFHYFTMLNDEFILDHSPAAEWASTDGAMNSCSAIKGDSLPVHSYIKLVNGKRTEANYMQWSTAATPPSLFNTDRIDVIDLSTLVPRAHNIEPRLTEVAMAREPTKPTDAKVRYVLATSYQSPIYGVDPKRRTRTTES